MVVPIIAGTAILSFVAFGKELFGEKTFNQIFKGLIVLGVIIISYIGYKMYKTYSETKEKVDEATEYVSDGVAWLFEGTKKTYEDVKEWTDESKIARQEAVNKLDPYLGIKTGIAPGSLEARQKEAGKKARQKVIDLYNAPTYYILKGKEKILSLFDR